MSPNPFFEGRRGDEALFSGSLTDEFGGILMGREPSRDEFGGYRLEPQGWPLDRPGLPPSSLTGKSAPAAGPAQMSDWRGSLSAEAATSKPFRWAGLEQPPPSLAPATDPFGETSLDRPPPRDEFGGYRLEYERPGSHSEYQRPPQHENAPVLVEPNLSLSRELPLIAGSPRTFREGREPSRGFHYAAAQEAAKGWEAPHGAVSVAQEPGTEKDVTAVVRHFESVDDPNEILEALKSGKGLENFSPEAVKRYRSAFEKEMLPVMRNTLDDYGSPGAEIATKLWNEPNLGNHLGQAWKSFYKGGASTLSSTAAGFLKFMEFGNDRLERIRRALREDQRSRKGDWGRLEAYKHIDPDALTRQQLSDLAATLPDEYKAGVKAGSVHMLPYEGQGVIKDAETKQILSKIEEFKEDLERGAPDDPRMHWATRSLYSGAGQMPAQLLTAPSTPLSAVSNFAQMYDEDSSGMLASLKKVRFEEARQKGVAFKDAEAWWNALTEDQREEMEDEAGQKALVSAIPNAALETIADKVLIGKLPLPAKLQKAILVWRKSNPRLALGARVGASVLGKLLAEGSTETGQGLVSDVSRGVLTGDKVEVARNMGPNFVGGLEGALATTPLSVHEAFGATRAENNTNRLRERPPAADSLPGALAPGNSAFAPSTGRPVNVEQPPGKMIAIGNPASRAFSAAAEAAFGTGPNQDSEENMAVGDQYPPSRLENPVAERQENVRRTGEERSSDRTQVVPISKARPHTGRTLAIKQMLLEEQLADIQQGIDQTNPHSPIGQIMAFRQEELQNEIAQVHEERIEAIRTLLSEEMARREEIQGPGNSRAYRRAQGIPSPTPQAPTGRTLAIKQMLLEEQLAKVQQGMDQTNPHSPIGQIMALRQQELENEIAQVHEERNEAIRILLIEEMSGSAANPNVSGWPIDHLADSAAGILVKENIPDPKRPGKPPGDRILNPSAEYVQRLEKRAKQLYYPGIGFLDWAEGMVKEFGAGAVAPLAGLWKKAGGLSGIKPAKNYSEVEMQLKELQSKRKELYKLKDSISHFDWRSSAITKMFELISDESLAIISVPNEEQATIALFHPSVSAELAWKIGQGSKIVRQLISSKLGNFFLNIQITANEIKYTRDKSRGFNTIKLCEGVTIWDVAHEIAHDIEERHPDIKKTTRAFLMKRAIEGETVPLSVLTKNPRDTDFVHLDKWRERGGRDYTGRDYPDGSTEILTTGIERLARDPALFHEQDPEFFELVVRIFHSW